MEWSRERRCGTGRRTEDLHNAAIARVVEHELAAVVDLVESVGAGQELPPAVTEQLQRVDRELTRIMRLAHEVAPVRTREAADAHRLATHLTAREWQCLGLLAQGLSTNVIAEGIGVSTTTVRTHIQSLLTKLGVHSRLQAVALTTRTSLLAAAPEDVHSPNGTNHQPRTSEVVPPNDADAHPDTRTSR